MCDSGEQMATNGIISWGSHVFRESFLNCGWISLDYSTLQMTDMMSSIWGAPPAKVAGSPIEPLYKLTRRALLLASDEVQRALRAKHGAINVLRLRDPVRQQQDCVSVL